MSSTHIERGQQAAPSKLETSADVRIRLLKAVNGRFLVLLYLNIVLGKGANSMDQPGNR